MSLISHLCWFHSSADAERFGRVCSSHHPRVFFTFVLTCAIFVVMLILVGWNTYGVLNNETALEAMLNKWEAEDWKQAGYTFRNPYDLGKWRNILEVFGSRPGDGSVNRRARHFSVMEFTIPALQRLVTGLSILDPIVVYCSSNCISRALKKLLPPMIGQFVAPHPASYMGYPRLFRPVRVSAREGGLLGTLFLLSPTFQPMLGDGVIYETVQMITNPHAA